MHLYDSGCRDAFRSLLAIEDDGSAYTTGGGCYVDENGNWQAAILMWRWLPTGELGWVRGFGQYEGGFGGNLLLSNNASLFARQTMQYGAGSWSQQILQIGSEMGHTIWASVMPPHSDLRRMAMDSNGDLYLAGLTTNAPVGPSPQDGLVVKVRGTDGQVVWMKNYHHGSEYGGADNFYDVAVDRHGNVYACGLASVSGNWHDFLLVKYRQPIRGDVNLDGCVDDQDLALQLEAFGTFDDRYDSNGDGFVDMADVLLLLDHFGQGCE